MKIKQTAMRDLSFEGVNEKERTVTFTFMTEAPCDNWETPEICLCKEENVDLQRFQNGVMPCLFNHNRDVVIGNVQSIDFVDGKVKATVAIDTDEESEKYYKKILSGSLKGVSVGYRRINTVLLPKGKEYNGRSYEKNMYITDKWQPYEVSIVSCPADPDCGVGRDLTIEGDKEMDKENIIDVEKATAEAVKAERERTLDIHELCKKFDVSDEKERGYIENDKITVNDVRKDILDEMAKKQVATDIHIGEDDKEKFEKKAVDSMLLRYGVINETEAVDGAEQYRGLAAHEIMKECMFNAGMSEKEIRRKGKVEAVESMLGERAMGSEQFFSVIDGFANKVLLKGYTEQKSLFRNFVSKGSNPDFKPVNKYIIGLDGEPVLMPAESGEFKYQDMSDTAVATGIQTYGKGISFTREIFINDDIGTVARVIQKQAAGFERLHDRMFFEILTKSKTLFSAANKNVVATNKDISIKAYDEMYTLMAKQMDNEERGYVGVFPKFLLAGLDNRLEHATLLHSTAQPGQANPGVVNVMQNVMQLFVSPYIEGKEYYAIADPSEMEGIEYTTLNGIDRPQSRKVLSTNHLGIDYQFWQDFGFTVLNHRAFVKNAGK